MKSLPVYDIGTLSHQREHELHISKFGDYVNNHHKNLHSSHKHSFYHLVFFTKGGGAQTIDFQSFPVRPNQVYFMVPGQVHSWAFEGEVDGYIINFSGSFFQSFLLKANYIDELPFFGGIAQDAVIDLPAPTAKIVIDLFEQLLAEVATPTPMGNDMTRALMLQIFITIARLANNQMESNVPAYNQTLLHNFQKLIEKNYSRLKLPKEYAALLFITPNHLNALCNAVVGISAGEVIRNRILLEAKRLLVSRDMTVLEIADHLNFTDNSYFTKFFKKLEGQTPEAFRKTQSQQDHGKHSKK